MWGVVKGFQIACNFTGPLGNLTGTGDQPSRKAHYSNYTIDIVDLVTLVEPES